MPTLFTIGHSNHTLKEFITILKAYKINYLIDIRSIPKSRYVPHFNGSYLKSALNRIGIKYIGLKKLGGRRAVKNDSINTAWQNLSFRGFADYMQTSEFFSGLKELNQFLKKNNKVAIMCAEALPWRCHRSLVADAEIVRGIKVIDIISSTQLRPHSLTHFAVVNRKKRPIQVYYPN